MLYYLIYLFTHYDSIFIEYHNESLKFSLCSKTIISEATVRGLAELRI